MKTVSVRCPECNATLEAGADTREVRCSYCNTLVVIQRRTLFLQRPAPIPERPPEAPPARVATEKRSVVGIVIGSLLGFLPLIVAPIVLIATCNLAGTPWGSVVPLDGGEHFIAVLRARESEVIRLAAYETRTGKRRWKSKELRRGTELLGVLCVAGDLVIDGDRGPGLTAVNLADGKIRWRTRLAEAVTGLCAGPDAKQVLVMTADKKHYPLALADGAIQPAVAGSECKPLPCAERGLLDRAHHPDGGETKRWTSALPGMRLEGVVPAGTVSLGLGHKTPGTSVPMIAAARVLAPGAAKVRAGDFTGGHGDGGVELLWQAIVPAGDPLASTSRMSADHLAVDDKLVAVAYELRNDSKYRLTVFSLADGRRRFDLALPEEMRAVWSVLLVPGAVIVTSTWGVIAAYDLDTGKERFTID